jgi:hypothetical protein
MAAARAPRRAAAARKEAGAARPPASPPFLARSIVADRLRPMDSGRRAYQLIGGVLCERTVGVIAPALESNREAIEQLIASLNEQARAHAAGCYRCRRRFCCCCCCRGRAHSAPLARGECATKASACFHAPPLFPRPFSPHPQLKATNAERTTLQKKHGIRVVSREQAERIAAEQQQALAAKQQGATAGGGS